MNQGKAYFAAAAIALCVLGANPASADLLRQDYQTTGDGMVTYDPTTGLKWLDVPVANGLSPNQATAANPGYQLATLAQVETLMEDAGIEAAHINANSYYTSDLAAMNNLAQLLRLPDIWPAYYGAGAAGWEYTGYGNILDSSGTGWDAEALDARNPPLSPIGESSWFLGEGNCLDCSTSNDFNFLVSTQPTLSSVPEPASIAMLGGVIVILGRAFRGKRLPPGITQ